jgi:6-pyruvoyltetrahydropterin/6-carboxytetrahydropterin synthase
MPYTICKRFDFSASHVLNGLPEGHPCGRMHGHSYSVIVELEADKLDGNGMVVDYRALDPFKQWIDEHLDHRHLNDAMVAEGGPEQPTAEYIAAFLWTVFWEMQQTFKIPHHGRLKSMTVKETEKTSARFES